MRAGNAPGCAGLSIAVSILVKEIRISMEEVLLTSHLGGSAAPDVAAATEATARAERLHA